MQGTKEGTSEELSFVVCCSFLSIFKKSSCRWQCNAVLAFQRPPWFRSWFHTLLSVSMCMILLQTVFSASTSGLFYVKLRIIYHFLTESIVLCFALCFCQHCFIAAYAISFKSSLILSCDLIYSMAQRWWKISSSLMMW